MYVSWRSIIQSSNKHPDEQEEKRDRAREETAMRERFYHPVQIIEYIRDIVTHLDRYSHVRFYSIRATTKREERG